MTIGTKINQYDKDGLRHGLWESYYSNGSIKTTTNYHHGTMHGAYTEFYSNGKISESVNCLNGYMEGLRYWNDLDGRGLLKGSYRRSNCVGLFYECWRDK